MFWVFCVFFEKANTAQKTDFLNKGKEGRLVEGADGSPEGQRAPGLSFSAGLGITL